MTARMSSPLWKRKTLLETDCCVPDQRSVTQWWWPSQCWVLGAVTSTFWNEMSKSTGNIIVVLSFARCCYQIFVVFLGISTHFGKTASQHIVLALPSRCWKQETPDFIPPDLWSLNSPDLIPQITAYGAYCRGRYTNIVSTTWMSWSIGCVLSGLIWIMRCMVAAAIHQWRHRLPACVKAGGGHFEHRFWVNPWPCTLVDWCWR